MAKHILANFGKLPLANNLLNTEDEKFEKYPLVVGFDDKTKLISLKKNAPKELMFNETYVYDSSQSKTMIEHFRDVANKLEARFKPANVLEIGSNSGIFIKNFECTKLAVEPCNNFARKTRAMGIETICEYWDQDLAEGIWNSQEFDLIFSSNTISHVHDLDSCFKGINICLSDNGVFVMESPSLYSIIKNNIIDQFYHEHQSYFSLTSVVNLLKKYNLEVFDVEEIPVHGGSLRYYIKHKLNKISISKTVKNILEKEKKLGLGNVKKLKRAFKQMLINLKNLKTYLSNQEDKIIIAYGATAKLSLILNIAGINKSMIRYVIDTTPEKQNKYIPGTGGIKILPYSKKLLNQSEICFLGAWNYKKEILKKESKYIKDGGIFVTHISKCETIDSLNYESYI